MEGIFDIYRGGEKIGKAEVRREGLYYRFRCCCNLTGEVMYRICITCGGDTENLGIPVPEGDAFYLCKKLPVSRFPEGMPEFRATPRHEPLSPGMWIPISPEMPFSYLARLEQAVTERRNGQIGILISAEAPPDSDPNPLYLHE